VTSDLAGPSMPSHGAGSQQALRKRNMDMVLQQLRDAGPAIQRDLANTTSLSPATVSNLGKVLRANNLVRTCYTTRSGRRSVLVEAL